MDTINSDIRNIKNDIDVLLKRTRNYEDSTKLINNLDSKLEKRLTDMGMQGVQRRFQNRIDALEDETMKLKKYCRLYGDNIHSIRHDMLEIERNQFDILKALNVIHEHTLLPETLVKEAQDIVRYYSSNDEEYDTGEYIFEYQDESTKEDYDFYNDIINIYNSKCVKTCSQWLTLNTHINNITKCFYDLTEGLTENEPNKHYLSNWLGSIQELISYIQTLPSKQVEDMMIRQTENLDMSIPEKTILQDNVIPVLNRNKNTISSKYASNVATTLTRDNLLETCVEYTKIYKPDVPCIVKVLHHMLSSKLYVLSKHMFDEKLNLEQFNTDFKLQAYQDLLTEDELKSLLFV